MTLCAFMFTSDMKKGLLLKWKYSFLFIKC